MVNDHPIPIFSECTVLAGFFEQSGKFLFAVNFLDFRFHRTEDDFPMGDVVIFHHPVGNDAIISEISAGGHFADFFNIEKEAAQLAVKVIPLKESDWCVGTDVQPFSV